MKLPKKIYWVVDKATEVAQLIAIKILAVVATRNDNVKQMPQQLKLCKYIYLTWIKFRVD